MKKILFGALLLAAFISCSRDERNDVWEGSDVRGSQPGEAYIRQISEYLIVDNLKELEQAIYRDSLGTATNRRYIKNGESIRTVGSSWILKDDERDLEGLEISMIADSTWHLRFDDEYEFEGRYDSDAEFRTAYTITAKQQHDSLGRSRGHCAWRISIEGTRYENKGYVADFRTAPDFLFKGGVIGSWTSCTGILLMDVSKKGNSVDLCRIEYFGSRRNYVYMRGL